MAVIPVMTCILLIEPIPFGHHLGGGGVCALWPLVRRKTKSLAFLQKD